MYARSKRATLFFILCLNMVRSLKVTKGTYPVQLTIDEQGLRIEGDLNAAKKCIKYLILLSPFILNVSF